MGNVFSIFSEGIFCEQVEETKMEFYPLELKHLPAEVQLTILKCLNYDELFKFKQTNRHFCDFVNKHKNCLARKRFNKLTVLVSVDLDKVSNEIDIPLKLLNKKSINVSLSKTLLKKWQSAVGKIIPVFTLVKVPFLFSVFNKMLEPAIVLEDLSSPGKNPFLRLPLFPKTIEEFKTVRYWLEQIFFCNIEHVNLTNYTFNPQMIKLLFDNDEINKIKLYCHTVEISFPTRNVNAWKFNFGRLIACRHLEMASEAFITTNEEHIIYNNILWELLPNECHKIPLVVLNRLCDNQIGLYNKLVNYLETSKDLSEMANKIKIYFLNGWKRSQLIVKGKELNQNNKMKKCYEITNIHNKQIKFSILWVKLGFFFC
ncbi:F-box domain-containing protein [Meloidogyne graminicola]|uniref:F-box domain-containing protein n=1 Tax=Meloidogyne graminicola TaxID=189291 RepID=A0A8S9ZU25_9BILA|nr:F-box domain-containing protein [Meloidogyne graminicola]